MLLSREQASAFVASERRLGRVIVFTNGVFDILHPGHVRYLRDARALGDLLVVGVNSDRSVKALAKAPDRPINRESERAEVLSALASVDAVVVFDEDTPHAIISAVQPDILVKGADWGENEIVGRDVVEARGGSVVRVQLAAGYLTTVIVARSRRVSGPATARSGGAAGAPGCAPRGGRDGFERHRRPAHAREPPLSVCEGVGGQGKAP